MGIETDPLKNLEYVINANRKLTSRIGSAASGFTSRLGQRRPEERRFSPPDETEAQKTLKRYVGRLMIAGNAAGRTSVGLQEQSAIQIAAAVESEGVIEKSRAIAICSIAPQLPHLPADSKSDLERSANRLRNLIESIDNNVVTRVIEDPIIVDPINRPGSPRQQAYSGLNRAIKTFERRLDPETGSQKHSDEFAMIAMTNPFQIKDTLEIPEQRISIGGVLTLDNLGKQPDQNEWRRLPKYMVETL